MGVLIDIFGDILVVRKRVLKSVGRVKPVGASAFPK
jgi:hypothetical protein